jgi:hypothetical protein
MHLNSLGSQVFREHVAGAESAIPKRASVANTADWPSGGGVPCSIAADHDALVACKAFWTDGGDVNIKGSIVPGSSSSVRARAGGQRQQYTGIKFKLSAGLSLILQAARFRASAALLL